MKERKRNEIWDKVGWNAGKNLQEIRRARRAFFSVGWGIHCLTIICNLDPS